MVSITLHFLAGLPRSGSTVLAAILNQNPKMHVSTTSGLGSAVGALIAGWQNEPLLSKKDLQQTALASMIKGLIAGYYETQTKKPVVIDKSRGWADPIKLRTIENVLQRTPKVLATVRSVPDCMASFVRLIKPTDLDVFFATTPLVEHLKKSYITLCEGLQYNPQLFHIIEYDNLISQPKKELQRIHDFLALPRFAYDFDNIDGTTVKEDDDTLHGFHGLHDIKPKLGKQHDIKAEEVLRHYYGQFCQSEFWLDTPRTFPNLDDLDLQLAASVTGNFVEGKTIGDKLACKRPGDHRAAFNRGWYALREGNIQEGYALLHRGRNVSCFGNKRPQTPQPEWNGKTPGKVLLYLEGGLGDQIHQIRYAKNLVEKGCQVIVGCTGELADIFQESKLVSAVVQHGAEYGVYHDYWLPAMSAPLYLGLTRDQISGAPYICNPIKKKRKRKRIGLRWSGNKQFEDVHHKLFPPEPFFEAVRRDDVEYISLQRDADVEYTPPWVKKVPLTRWSDTRKAIGSCDIVITCCTSVAHLAAAMGIPTWTIIPVMGYYLYAEPGNASIYYNSMTLFRQTVYGDWTAPMQQIKEALKTVA